MVMFFGNYRYPEVTVDGKVDAVSFLQASGGIVKFVELLGKVFLPVKYDINGNIEKLQNIINTDKEKFIYLSDIVEYEMTLSTDSRIGIDALLWLKRALEYIQAFLTFFVADHKQGKQTEDLIPFFKKAYEEKLQPYHGWMVQKLFGLCLLAAPGRKVLLQLLSMNKDNITDDDIMADIEEFLCTLNKNLEVIIDMYNKNNLNCDTVA